MKDRSLSTPPLPDFESQRLEELYALHLLDTQAEERFDRYTQMAADAFAVPVALISLIDRHRQWFKSSHGLKIAETPRDISFCAHTLIEKEILTVADTALDPRFAHNPLVTGEPHIRFYAGAVLRGPTGQPVGTLCLIDYRPRELTTWERRLLVTLASLIEQELRDVEHEKFFLLSHDLLAVVRYDGCLHHTNPAWERKLGYSKSASIAQPFVDLIHPEDRAAMQAAADRLFAAEQADSLVLENRCRGQDGRYHWLQWSIISPGQQRLLFCTGRDISERRRSEQQLQLWGRVVAVTSNGVVITDPHQPDNPMVSVNPAFTQITGYSAEEVLGRNCRFLQGIDRDQSEVHTLRAAIARQQACTIVLRNYRKDGSLFWNELFISPSRDAMGRITHYIGVMNDITERQSYEAQLEHQVTHDGLTQLPNRVLLRDRLEHALEHAPASGQRIAVLFLDLDRFKLVNDSLGHAAGDTLLQAVAIRLNDCAPEADTIARQGGDEFVILLRGGHSLGETVMALAYRILESFERSFIVHKQEFFIAASIGISLTPDDGMEAETLLRNADAAMYQAKLCGGNSMQFYTSAINTRTGGWLTLEKELRYALARQELQLHYQPQVSLEQGAMIGVEALLRWRHPRLGLVSPTEFIPLAEATGLIVPIGEWVLKTACAQVKAWCRAGLGALPVSVNISVRQFTQGNLPALVALALEETGLEPHYLELEITESLLMQDIEQAMITLKELKALGVQLAIDDFGTGYSSLNYLKRFPLDRLKIDRSFIDDITTESDSATITLLIIALAHGLRLKVIAEGVETEDQLDFLRQHHCDETQGYYFSRPLAPAQMADLLQDYHTLPEKILRQGERGYTAFWKSRQRSSR
ncbi:MAG: EAL domain-containing protein [Candidatus Competibacteraceae bacterium]|nr:EAL domain-containing protein [Candidatus Competibacteraceae bacterium]